MYCQECGKKNATTFVKTIVNGTLTQYALCEGCGKKMGVGSLFEEESLGSLLGSFFGTTLSSWGEQEAVRCPKCHSTFSSISQSGKIGCTQCYQTFRSNLMPLLQRIHGTARHKGKIPGGSALRLTDSNTKIVPVIENGLEEKKRLLKKAIEQQEFEQAAVLRDEIKEMEP